jgi:hypothetical protein
VQAALLQPYRPGAPLAAEFETAFATYVGRKHALAVASGTLGLLLVLKATGIVPDNEVIVSPYSWRELAHAVVLAGAKPVFADIDYWSGTLNAEKVAARIGPKTRAIIGGNANGHPAPWAELRDVATQHGLILIEDSSEALGARYKGGLVGTFGDCSVFDFSQPGALTCGEGGMIVTDNDEYAAALRRLRSHRVDERASLIVSSTAPYQAVMGECAAALGLAQLKRLDSILARRKRVERWYFDCIKSFEGIKDPYIAPDVSDVNWFLYVVHLGTRFSRSSRDAIVDDLRTERIDAAAYCQPLHIQRCYVDAGYRRGDFRITEKIAERAVALPYHGHLTEEKIAFIVGTMKDASINVGAGTAIYL